MCISCRERFSRGTLIRLQLQPQSIVRYNGAGRSFYLCEICATNQKKQTGLAKRFKVNETHLKELLKEILNNG